MVYSVTNKHISINYVIIPENLLTYLIQTKVWNDWNIRFTLPREDYWNSWLSLGEVEAACSALIDAIEISLVEDIDRINDVVDDDVSGCW